MKFPYAAKGVSKIFSAEILSLIGSIGVGIASVVLTILMINSDSGSELTVNDGIVLGIIIAVAVLAVIYLIGGIMKIVGYIQAAKDEDGFKKAICCTIFSLIFSFTYYLLFNQTGFLGWLGTIMYATSQLLSMLVAVFTLGGLINLSQECNRPDMAKRGSELLTTLIVLYIITFLATFLKQVGAETNAFGEGIIKWLAFLSACLMFFIYVFQLIYLGKAKKMLREN